MRKSLTHSIITLFVLFTILEVKCEEESILTGASLDQSDLDLHYTATEIAVIDGNFKTYMTKSETNSNNGKKEIQI